MLQALSKKLSSTNIRLPIQFLGGGEGGGGGGGGGAGGGGIIIIIRRRRKRKLQNTVTLNIIHWYICDREK